MTESDDPFLTPAVIGSALLSAGVGVGLTALSGGFKKADKQDFGSITAPGQATKTSEPVMALSEQAKKNRRLAASSLTREFVPPTLGISALVGA